VVKRTGDGAIIEFRSVVDAVRCAIEVQNAMVERNSGVPQDRHIEFRIGIHLGDVVEEDDGDLMGDGVNIAARLESVAKPGAICLSEDAYRQVKSRLDLNVRDLGTMTLKNIAEPVRAYSVEVGKPPKMRKRKVASGGRLMCGAGLCGGRGSFIDSAIRAYSESSSTLQLIGSSKGSISCCLTSCMSLRRASAAPSIWRMSRASSCPFRSMITAKNFLELVVIEASCVVLPGHSQILAAKAARGLCEHEPP
jgi:Adenylate and Guanylate cyclase catalytic domain